MDRMIDSSLPNGLSFFTGNATIRERQRTDSGKISNCDDAEPDSAIKGMIPYPCCPKEAVIAFLNAHGQASNKCPKCGKFVRFDYDRMTATAFRAYRGASQQYKTQK